MHVSHTWRQTVLQTWRHLVSQTGLHTVVHTSRVPHSQICLRTGSSQYSSQHVSQTGLHTVTVQHFMTVSHTGLQTVYEQSL